MSFNKLVVLFVFALIARQASAQTLKDAYRNLWRTSVSVNQWQVEGDQSKDW